MSYEEHRAFFSHAILENGFFCYLSEPPAFWRKRDLAINVRAEYLAQHWREVTERMASLRHAYDTWNGRDGAKGIPVAAVELYEMAKIDPIVRPSLAFPQRDLLSEWLDAMSSLMNALMLDGFIYQASQESKVAPFWQAGLAMYEFFQGTKIGSPQFWFYYERRS